MFKRISCLALSVMFLMGVLVQQVAAFEGQNASILDDLAALTEPDTTEEIIVPVEEEVVPEGPVVLVNDAVVDAAVPVIYESTTYVPLRAITEALRPDAVISWEGDHAAVTAENLSIEVYPNAKYIVANGRCLYLPYGVQLMDGVTLLPVRVLATAFDAQVEWDAETGNVTLIPGTGAILPAEVFYREDDLYWLSHIINAESGNQPLDGKISVGNVVLNRVCTPGFPDTIYEVIFQRNQFTPAHTGTINLEPNEESIIAAKLCLEGAVVLPDALWFNRAGISCWASRNKECIATIGNHAFYA